MNDIAKEILEKYQIRKKRAQKTEFIRFMQEKFPEMKVEEGGFGKNRNLVIGDPDSAKAVLGAHYDTCAVLPFPNFIMPKSILVSFLYGVLIAVPVIIISFAVSGMVMNFTDNFLLSQVVYFAVAIGIFALFFCGKPNRHTVNDNTSGVIMLTELLSEMAEEERAQYCFVFFDNEENGLLGSSFFEKKHRETMEDKLLINFDCVSDGDYLMLILNKRALPEYLEDMKAAFEHVNDKTVLTESGAKVYYPSDQKNFRKNIAAASFKKGPFGLYMDRIHTPRDTVMDERNIEVLRDGITDFLRKSFG